MPGSCAGNYIITRTFTATDNCSNSTSCVQHITVVDTTPPVISCPGDNTVNCTNSTDVAATGNATATDDCSGVAAITHTDATTPGSCAGNYTITRTFTATDNCSNSASCVQHITVVDTTPPSFTSCPADIVKSTDPGQCSGIVNYTTATAADNCSGATVVCNPPSASTFQKGTTTVSCTATDGCGNTNNCSFTVTVNDTQAPTIACPANIM